MDMLNPRLHWIGKRCYRVNAATNDDSEQQTSTQSNEYVEADLYGDDELDDNVDDYEINQLEMGRFQTIFHVPKIFHGIIIGSQRATIKRIEGDTKTQIKIPNQRDEGPIKVLGSTRDAVSSARRRIEALVLESRTKRPPTHFTCVPITNGEIRENYRKFVEQASKISCPGLKETMFQTPEKLHLTLGVMYLADKEDRARATQLLNDCLENIIKPIKERDGKIMVKMSGLNIMNDDPSKVRVLYGKIESDTLQEIADKIYNYYIAKDMAKREFNRDSVKLHLTLINTTFEVFRKSSEGDEDDRRSKRRSNLHFDARPILEEFKDFDFGTQEVSEIHLSIRHAKGPDGFYEPASIVRF